MYVSLDLKLFPSREYWKVEIREVLKKKEEEEKERVGKYSSETVRINEDFSNTDLQRLSMRVFRVFAS